MAQMFTWRWLCLCTLLGLTSAMAFAANPADKPAASATQAAPAAVLVSPVGAEESLKNFVLPEGVRIELVAAEPEVIDPVACRFDEDGRLWVVEMRDYPDPPAPGEPGRSRIRVLEDRDGDGRYETARTFADKLLFATGILPWRGGLLATISGKVVYLRDTDGDGQADNTEVWFTGFAEENPQLRVNHPRFALDNYVYVNSGLRGGTAVSARAKDPQPLPLRNRDLRFDPLGTTGELAAGAGQFGMTFDDYGHRFIVSNRNPLIQVVLAEQYLHRNPLATIAAVQTDVAASGDASHIFPISETWTTSINHAGQFTAACGICIFRGHALPAEYYGNSFTCEPTGNLIHRETIASNGATFVGTPARKDRDFLTTRDTWFRPVNTETGPDGALYIVDMYRAVIEHPQFMPEELKKRPDLRYGDDRGRIYRIVSTKPVAKPAQPALGKASSADLVAYFEQPTAWWRETAARLLYERQDQMAVPALRKMAASGKAPAARAQALWTLEGLKSLQADDVQRALADADANVREQALRLAESRLADVASLKTAAVKLCDDADARVRFQAALSLGGVTGDDVSSGLAKVAVRDVEDVWAGRAVMCARPEHMPTVALRLMDSLRATGGEASEAQLALLENVVRMIGASRDAGPITQVLLAARQSTGPSATLLQLTAFQAVAAGMRSKGGNLSQLAKSSDSSEVSALVDQVTAQAVEAAQSEKASLAVRLEACDVLRYVAYDTAAPVLKTLAGSEASQPLRARAASVLATFADPRVGLTLLELLPRQSPSVRNVLLDGLIARPERIVALLDAIEAGKLKPGELGVARATQLSKLADVKIRERATKLLASALPADRTKVLDQYQAALKLEADPVRGKEVFRKNCSTCHRLSDVGIDVGPSLGFMPAKSQLQVLTDILQPNRAIDNNFVSYTLVTTDGLAYTGIILAETPSSLTMRVPEGKTLTLLRGNIDELQSNGISLMPDGLEKNISLQEMADCISFVKNWRYVDSKMSVRVPTAGQ
ncbi:MAG: c-type cytochrome [Planctomycetes bacterium]|nr:c-type cytochrome [Planctomycetota bacterium]